MLIINNVRNDFLYPGPWILGKFGETCQQVCNRNGRICNVEKQSSLITNQLVVEKMAEAGYTCKGFHHLINFGIPFSSGQDGQDCGPMDLMK